MADKLAAALGTSFFVFFWFTGQTLFFGLQDKLALVTQSLTTTKL